MPSLFFPQLLSGSLAQYPLRKARLLRTIKNILPDGSMQVSQDPGASQLIWQLAYANLSSGDIGALMAHFQECAGPLRGFTFIDPTDNMLSSSSNLAGDTWQRSDLLKIVPGMVDPMGGTSAFAITNTGQATLTLSQVLIVPANYQYCLSTYACSAQNSTLTLMRYGASATQTNTYTVGPTWNRVACSGRLNDSGTTLTVAISLNAGQEIELYGVQLEAQIAPSRYRATQGSGGVYPNAHWAVDQLTTMADGPDLFSTSFSIETFI